MTQKQLGELKEKAILYKKKSQRLELEKAAPEKDKAQLQQAKAELTSQNLKLQQKDPPSQIRSLATVLAPLVVPCLYRRTTLEPINNKTTKKAQPKPTAPTKKPATFHKKLRTTLQKPANYFKFKPRLTAL